MFTARFQWLSALPLLAVTAALAVIAIGALSGSQSRSSNSREVLFDYYQRLKPAAQRTASPFHIISIDRESADAIGPWPWPRTILADLVEKSGQAGAKGVIVVEPVDTPDPLSPEVIGAFWLNGSRDDELGRQLALLPSTDKTLAQALTGVEGAISISPAAKTATRRWPLGTERAETHDTSWLNVIDGGAGYIGLPSARPRFSVNTNLLEAADLGVEALPADPDGKIRTAPLLWSVDGEARPLIGLEAARLASPDQSVSVKTDPTAVSALGATPRYIGLDDELLPVAGDATLRLYFSRRLDTPTTPAWRIMNGEGSNSQLTDKIVLIGLSTEMGDTLSTPRGAFSPAELHALIGEQIVAGSALKRPLWTGYLEAIFVMLLGAGAIMLAQRLDFWKTIGVAALASVVLFAFSFMAFAFSNLLINPLPPSLALFLGGFSVAGGRSLGVVLKDDSVRGAFQDALPEPTMKKLREEGSAEILDGVYRPLTILACELRLLDDDARNLATHPEDITNMIAAACVSLRKTIIDTGGAVDQAEGGKMFGYFNAPLETADHVSAACSSALRLVESMDKINAELDASQRTRGVSLHLAIGVATGECFAGPMGHGRFNRYSAVGRAVNLASFLRRQAEFYGPAIICDETVHRKTHHHFAYLELDRLKLADAEHPFSIHALVGNPFIKSSKSYRSLDDTHRQLLAAYREGDWMKARSFLNKTKENPGAKIALFDIYEERIAKMAEKEAPEGWNGAHEVSL